MEKENNKRLPKKVRIILIVLWVLLILAIASSLWIPLIKGVIMVWKNTPKSLAEIIKNWNESMDEFYDSRSIIKDGFRYYITNEEKKEITLLDLPDVEEVVIPEYIDGYRTVQLGVLCQSIKEPTIKKLKICHNIIWKGPDIRSEGLASFPNLEILIFEDFPYTQLDNCRNGMDWLVPQYIGKKPYDCKTEVHLTKSIKEYGAWEDTMLYRSERTKIEIPSYVTKIDAGVFDGLEGVTLITWFENQPEGWQDGWNGNCNVLWGRG